MSARILHVLLHLSFLCDFNDIFLLDNTVTPKPVMGPQEGVKFQQINIRKKCLKIFLEVQFVQFKKCAQTNTWVQTRFNLNIGKLLNISSRTAKLLLHVYNHLYILISLYQGHNGTYFFLIIISSKIYIRYFKV